MSISAIITVYLFLNSLEVLANRDLPYISALVPMRNNLLLEQLSHQVQVNPNLVKTLHRPLVLRFKNPSAKLELLPEIKINHQYLARTNKGHYLVLNEHPESGIGNTAIYLIKSWRTIPHPDTIHEDSRLFLETEHYINMYKVIEISLVPDQELYLLDTLEKPYLLLIIQDPDRPINYLIKTIFVVREAKDKS